MGRMETFTPVPPAAVSRVLATFDRDQLAGFIAVAIDLLDLADGDTDVEPNGDELDGTGGEDDFYPHSNWRGEPGCPISDPDLAVDDRECDDIDMDLEHDEALTPDWGIDQTEALPDAMVIASDRQNMHQHRDRIRQTRCYRLPSPRVIHGQVVEYLLRD